MYGDGVRSRGQAGAGKCRAVSFTFYTFPLANKEPSQEY